MNQRQKQLIVNCANSISLSDVVSRFYDLLLSEHPELSELFANVELPVQQRKLMDALKLVLTSLDDVDRLRPALRNLGLKHVEYGAQDDHYPIVVETLVRAIEESAGTLWDARTEEAWLTALNGVTQIMLEGAADNAVAGGVPK